MNAKTVEEQAGQGPEVNLALGIVRKDFGKIERAISAGAKQVDLSGAGEGVAGVNLDTNIKDPFVLAQHSGMNAGDLARLQSLLDGPRLQAHFKPD